MTKKKVKRQRLYLPPDDPPETVTLGEALATTSTTGVSFTHAITVSITPRRLQCPECNFKQNLTVPADAKISCPKCTERFFHKNIAQMQDLPPEPPPPGPPPPKPKLPGKQRYAKVFFEPINPKFRFIRFEDDDSEGKLWVNPGTPTLRHQQLVVVPNPDEVKGDWVISRDAPKLS